MSEGRDFYPFAHRTTSSASSAWRGASSAIRRAIGLEQLCRPIHHIGQRSSAARASTSAGPIQNAGPLPFPRHTIAPQRCFVVGGSFTPQGRRPPHELLRDWESVTRSRWSTPTATTFTLPRKRGPTWNGYQRPTSRGARFSRAGALAATVLPGIRPQARAGD